MMTEDRSRQTQNHLSSGFEKNGWLSNQDGRLRDAVLRVAQIVNVDRGDKVLNRAESATCLFGVLTGSAILSIEGLDSKMHPVQIIRRGCWMASHPDPVRVHRGFSANALEPSSFMKIQLADLGELIQDDVRYTKDMASVLDFTQDLLIGCGVNLLIRQSDRRVAAVLMSLAGLQLDEPEQGVPQPIFLSQRVIGEMSNASRDSINRIFSKFTKRGWISVSYLRVDITKPRMLSEFAKGR